MTYFVSRLHLGFCNCSALKTTYVYNKAHYVMPCSCSFENCPYFNIKMKKQPQNWARAFLNIHKKCYLPYFNDVSRYDNHPQEQEIRFVAWKNRLMEIDKIINQHIINLWSYKASYLNFWQKKYIVIKASI